jgi:prephenate dehydrogenase
LDQAIELGVIDEMATFADLMHADFVIVSVPVDVAHGCAQVLEAIGEQTIVFEVGSTKLPICEEYNHPKRFIATHPIAGTEFSGPSAAIKGLFQGKTNIICEVKTTLNCKNAPCFKKWDAFGIWIQNRMISTLRMCPHLSHQCFYVRKNSN